AVDRDRDLLPPRPPFALSRTEVKPHSRRAHGAADRLAKARPGDADAVVEVKLSVAVVARIDIELEWPLRHLHRALHQRLARQDRAGAEEYGKLVELRGQNQLRLGDRKTRPIIVPAAGRQADRERT